MIFEDDRTERERTTHSILVAMTDSFMSGWGQAGNGASYAAWACRHEDVNRVESWVRNRGDAKRVRIVGADWRPNPRYCAHVHVYVVHPGHPSIADRRKPATVSDQWPE